MAKNEADKSLGTNLLGLRALESLKLPPAGAGLKEHPFSRRVDARYVFLDPPRLDGMNQLVQALVRGESVGCVLGGRGLGKTAFLSRLAIELLTSSSARVLANADAAGTPMEKIILAREAFEAPKRSKLMHYKRPNVGPAPMPTLKGSVLLLDDAGTLSDFAWQQLREWRRSYVSGDAQLQVVLSATDLASVQDRAFDEPWPNDAVTCTLQPFDPDDAEALIGHRVHTAGAHVGAVFTAPAIAQICELGAGEPRRIVDLCRQTLDRADEAFQAPYGTDAVNGAAEQLSTPDQADESKWAGALDPEKRSQATALVPVHQSDADVKERSRSRRVISRRAGYALAFMALAAGGVFLADSMESWLPNESESRSAAESPQDGARAAATRIAEAPDSTPPPATPAMPPVTSAAATPAELPRTGTPSAAAPATDFPEAAGSEAPARMSPTPESQTETAALPGPEMAGISAIEQPSSATEPTDVPRPAPADGDSEAGGRADPDSDLPERDPAATADPEDAAATEFSDREPTRIETAQSSNPPFETIVTSAGPKAPEPAAGNAPANAASSFARGSESAPETEAKADDELRAQNAAAEQETAPQAANEAFTKPPAAAAQSAGEDQSSADREAADAERERQTEAEDASADVDSPAAEPTPEAQDRASAMKPEAEADAADTGQPQAAAGSAPESEAATAPVSDRTFEPVPALPRAEPGSRSREPVVLTVPPRDEVTMDQPAGQGTPAPADGARVSAADKAQAERLLQRGDELLQLGDLASARLLYRAAADKGSADAAAQMGLTFDPAFFEQTEVQGTRADPRRALLWYRRARDMGSTEVQARLDRLLVLIKLNAESGDPKAQRLLENEGNQ